MTAYIFDSNVYGGDAVVIASDISEAMIEMARRYLNIKDVTVTELKITRVNKEVYLAPSIATQLEVEALTR